MAADDLRTAIASLPQPWHARYFDRVGSTQDEARRAAPAGAPSRSLFVADFQSAGRGRQGRAWLAAPGQGLLLSILLRHTGRAARPWRSTALVSVAMAEAIEQLIPALDVAIKWPNDLLLDGRKVAGVLAESSSDGVNVVVIVGVGVNVNTSAEELEAIGSPATSLRVASGQRVERGQLLLVFVDRLDFWLARADADLQSRWQTRLWGRGQRLRLADLGVDEDVVVLGATLDGALRVRRADGTERTTTTGELIL
jgi:BirA family biotin operon repressor/biotin-[acetyl-CoA-carboxylase] ligase